ncbi:MAG: hypothetical protein P0119_09895 [Nitrospira sp.]|nr:hypothetical protein [Nitrospira sp.]
MSKDDLWLTEPGPSLFWKGLYQRCFSYLGQVEPTAKEGYRLVAAIQTSDYTDSAPRLEALCQSVGFEDAKCMLAVDALLSRWIWEQYSGEGKDVTVVAVGETVTEVRSYRVKGKTDHLFSISESGPSITLPGIGSASWLRRMLEEIHSRFKEPLPPGNDLVLHDATIEFVMRLGQSNTDQEIEWTGPFRERMYSVPRLSLHTCLEWPEVVDLQSSLSTVIQESMRSLGGQFSRDLTVIGGIGAIWPFVRHCVAACQTQSPIWQSSNPLEDVARGATYWPLLGEYPVAQAQPQTPIRSLDVSTAESAPKASGLPDRPPVLPPWKRQSGLKNTSRKGNANE